MIMQAKIFSKVAAVSLTCIYCGWWYSPSVPYGCAAKLKKDQHEVSALN